MRDAGVVMLDSGVAAANQSIEDLSFKVYERVLHTANKILLKCKSVELRFLPYVTPNIAELAVRCQTLAETISALAAHDMRGQQIYEYCALMTRISSAIVAQDEVELHSAVEELDKKPFILS